MAIPGRFQLLVDRTCNAAFGQRRRSCCRASVVAMTPRGGPAIWKTSGSTWSGVPILQPGTFPTMFDVPQQLLQRILALSNDQARLHFPSRLEARFGRNPTKG